MIRSLIACSLVLCASCIHRVPPQRLETPLPLTISLLEDRGDTTIPVPDGVNARVGEELEARNLIVRSIAPEPLFGGAHNSAQRFAALQAAAGDASLVVLVETRVTYYDLLEGQYRWVVHAKITAGHKTAQPPPTVDEAEVPVFLLYAHEKEPEALASAARVLAERAAELIDGFLAPPQQPATPLIAVPIGPPHAGLDRRSPAAIAASSAAVRALGNIYFVLIDRFADGDAKNDLAIDRSDPDAFHGGDLQGVLNKLDDLQKLGVQTIWLSPVFKTRQEKFFGHGAYHGYWVEDLNLVEPRFGDLTLLGKLSSELHRRGMKLLLDLVLNHVAFDSPLLKTHPDWFHHNGSIENWNDARQLEEFDVDGLPDLAQENEQVYRYLADSSLHWIDTVHPDGFRLDAVKHVPLAFWRRFNAEMRAHAGPDFVLLGEALEGSPTRLAAIQRDGGFDSLFDFPLSFALVDVFCKGASPERLAAILSLDRAYDDAGALVTMVDNHDLPRIASQCRGRDTDISQALAALAFVRGVPAIQYGTEAELAGEKEPQNRADLFDAKSANGSAAVSQSLRLRSGSSELATGKTIVLAAANGALALARVDAQSASLLLLARADAGLQRFDSALAPLAGAQIDSCLSWSETSAVAALDSLCKIRFAPLELHIYRLRPARPGAFDALLDDLPPREVRFALDATAHVQAAGALYIAGAGPELGDWDPAHALGPLPARQISVQLPSRSVAEYKLILKKPDGTMQWENGPDRFLFVPPGSGTLDVSLSWRI